MTVAASTLFSTYYINLTHVYIEVNCHCQLYLPAVYRSRIGYDIRGFVQRRTPSDSAVYNMMNIPAELHGFGLHALPARPNGGSAPRCAMSTLLRLILVSSPRRCLLGYEILAILMGHFKHFRENMSTNWQVYTNDSIIDMQEKILTMPCRRLYSTHSTRNPISPVCQVLLTSLALNVFGSFMNLREDLPLSAMVHLSIQHMIQEKTTTCSVEHTHACLVVPQCT